MRWLRERYCYAGAKDIGTGTKGEERGQISFSPSRRVCTRNDPAHPPRSSWSTFHEAGYRHRAVKGPPRRRQTSASTQRHGAGGNSRTGQTRGGKSPPQRKVKALTETISCNSARVTTGRPESSVSFFPGASCAPKRDEEKCSRTPDHCKEGGADTKSKRAKGLPCKSLRY